MSSNPAQLTIEPYPCHLRVCGMRPGPVLFDISNQTTDDQRFSVRRHGRVLAATPLIAPGQPAQLKVTLSGSGITFDTRGVDPAHPGATSATSTDLRLLGRAPTGNNALALP